MGEYLIWKPGENMYITFQELLQLKEMAMSNFVAGKKGIYHLITWYTISEIVDYKNKDYKNKLVFIAGVGMTEYNYENSLYEIFQYVSEHGAAGAIVEIGPYIPKIPGQLIELADQLSMPLITLPYDTKISMLNYAMSQLFFSRINYIKGMQAMVSKLLSCEDNYDGSFMNQAVFYGYRPENVYCVVKIEPDEKITGEDFDAFVLCIFEGLEKKGLHDFMWKQGLLELYLILPVEYHVNEHRTALLSVFPKPEKYGYSAGVGSLFYSLKDAFHSAAEAKEALYMIRQCGKKQEIRFFEDTGIYRLLFDFNNTEELTGIYQHTLGALLTYDANNNTELNLTLESYLDCDCNVTATAEKMNIHRNTIKYRIQKVREILNVDFGDYDQCFKLRLAYKIKKYGHI